MKREYQVLARQFRPQKFAEVVAQGPIVATLKNAIQMGRTAHAYLFCGSRGTGKTSIARLFAKTLNCKSLTNEIEPCNTCSSCREITTSHAIDVIEIDGASHRGIEDVRQINETIAFTPAVGRYKIYLIDEVHMLTKEAFNALLKTLEEPPAHAKFFFCTTEPHRIPATILSRCQRFNLRRIPIETIEKHLVHICHETSLTADPEALTLIAERAEGSLRDALSLFDQIIAFEKGTVTLSTVRAILGLPSKTLCFALDHAGHSQNLASIFQLSQEIYTTGQNLSYFLEELIKHFRTLLLIKCGHPSNQDYERSASFYRTDQLIHILEILTEGQQTLKSAPSERTALEILFLRIVRTQSQLSLETLVARLIALEAQLPPPPEAQKVETKLDADEKKALVTPPAQDNKTEPPSSSIHEQSRFDTVMRFAAKELNGSIQK
jgi:DNA polymerase III subunit gamma/tau